jgi:hypothetical protein
MRSRWTMFLAISTIAAVVQPVFSQAPARPARTKISPTWQTAFTAELKITTVKTLANGSTITREQTEVEAVDSHGRRYMSTITTQPESEERTITTVTDLAAGTRTTWVTPGQQATVTSSRVSAMATNCAERGVSAAPQTAQHRSMTTDDLGMETIEGVQAHGRRTTITTPAGLIGNSQPLVSTRESWVATAIKPFSPVLREINDDPESGKMTREATKVTLGEPDESLFQPPQGYEVVTRDTTQLSPCPVSRTSPAQTDQPQ